MFQEIYKVENLIIWLEGKIQKINQRGEQDERYNYNSCKMCLLAQYLRAHIPEFVSIGVDWWDNKGNRHEIPRVLNDIAFGSANKEDWTFGKALKRARYYLGN